ncbi:MAG: hypothetical protein COA47_11510 [Robiginitomaculum sp.]|nr:MAG: hypothetical protein COA47_11510 [Robiginitomaculum sp.]
MNHSNTQTISVGRLARAPLRPTRLQTGLALLLISGSLLIVALLANGQIPLQPDVLARMSLAIKIHVSSALFALVLGGLQFVLPKGRTLHIVMGCVWVLAMLVVAGSAFFIRDLFHGSFSPIHLFIIVTIVGLYRGLMPLIRGSKKAHGPSMRGTYIGALLVSGALAFLPGRIMLPLLFGS